MRNAKLTFDEIQAAEEASEARRQSRSLGFKKMNERDQAVKELSNGVTMVWHVNKELGARTSTLAQADGTEIDITVYPPNISEDGFALDIRCPHCKKTKRHLFNLHEFRRWLRWG